MGVGGRRARARRSKRGVPTRFDRRLMAHRDRSNWAPLAWVWLAVARNIATRLAWQIISFTPSETEPEQNEGEAAGDHPGGPARNCGPPGVLPWSAAREPTLHDLKPLVRSE
ncbi:MAG: hypothetical protein C0505_14425 [Leptothrix sp. (in: Bacteria)]|nr:hypothetical protein [Leptothrix sp. (in: b-proteobacteria)]